jgi:hypothetical protein
MTLTIRNAPAGAHAQLRVTTPDAVKRITYEFSIVSSPLWTTAASIAGFPSGSTAVLEVYDVVGNLQSSSSTTLP